MNPIINPWLIYVMNLADCFIGFAVACFFIGIVLLLISAGVCSGGPFMAYNDSEKKNRSKFLLLSIPFLMVAMLGFFVPSKNTIIQMIIAKNITPDNISKTIEVGKEIKSDIKKDVLDIVMAIKDEKK